MRLVAVTSCPTGIAHTYMAAESLEQSALAAGHEIAVEAQGAAGYVPLAADTIAAADAVILAADVEVRGRERFAGKPTVSVGVRLAITDAPGLLEQAVAAAGAATPTSSATSCPSRERCGGRGAHCRAPGPAGPGATGPGTGEPGAGGPGAGGDPRPAVADDRRRAHGAVHRRRRHPHLAVLPDRPARRARGRRRPARHLPRGRGDRLRPCLGDGVGPAAVRHRCSGVRAARPGPGRLHRVRHRRPSRARARFRRRRDRGGARHRLPRRHRRRAARRPHRLVGDPLGRPARAAARAARGRDPPGLDPADRGGADRRPGPSAPGRVHRPGRVARRAGRRQPGRAGRGPRPR